MALAKLLIEQNFPAIAIHRSMSQEERLSKYQQFKDFQKVRTPPVRCGDRLDWRSGVLDIQVHCAGHLLGFYIFVCMYYV